MPVGWAHLSELLGELEGIDQSESLVDGAANWQVVDGDLTDVLGWVDDEETTEGNTNILEENTVLLAEGVVLVGDEWEVDVSETSILAGSTGPGEETVCCVVSSNPTCSLS